MSKNGHFAAHIAESYLLDCASLSQLTWPCVSLLWTRKN